MSSSLIHKITNSYTAGSGAPSLLAEKGLGDEFLSAAHQQSWRQTAAAHR